MTEKTNGAGVFLCGVMPKDPPPGSPFSDNSMCPKCGGPTEMGFGLAGGGYGPYEFCANDDAAECDYFNKHQSDE